MNTMALADTQNKSPDETTYSTKRVFMRAEHGDEIEISKAVSSGQTPSIPGSAIVVSRELTYYGPRIRIEDKENSTQYLLTAPGPETEAILWCMNGKGWEKSVEVYLEFGESLPQYEICLHCNEPISTIAHRRRSVIGACNQS